jgi:hypothetical protein
MESNMKSKDEVVVEILNYPRNNPALLKNLMEAYDAGSPEDLEVLQDFMDQKQFGHFGLKLYSMSIDYQEKMAEEVAIYYFNQSLGE